MKKKTAFLLFFLGTAWTAMAGDVPDRPPEISLAFAADVGGGRVTQNEVLELWTPIWYETVARVRTGRLSTREGDARLREEWKRALNALVKDEVLYQEAVREHESRLNEVIEQAYSSAQGGGMTRAAVSEEIRRAIQQNVDNDMRDLTSAFVRESGGMEKLKSVLRGRGLTFEEWQSRLRKKVFTTRYMNTIIGPRARPNPGPARIREYYAGHPDEFTIPGAVRFRHVFFSAEKRGGDGARAAAAEAWQLITDGAMDFPSMARQRSDDPPSRERGGLETEGEADDPEREVWLSELRKAVREEVPDELGPILESPSGFHLVQLLSVERDRKTPFREVGKTIARKIENEDWQTEMDRYYRQITKEAPPVRILLPDFPPSLSCAAQMDRPPGKPAYYRLGGTAAVPGLDSPLDSGAFGNRAQR